MMKIETNNPYNPEIADEQLGEFHPVAHPELALQTYEYFGSDPNRKSSKEAFTDGETYHLLMQYPRLDIDVFDDLQAGLADRRKLAIDLYGENSLTVSSIDNRLEEVEFLRATEALNIPNLSGDKNAQEIASSFVSLTESLYGSPDQKLVDSILGTLYDRYNSSDPRVQQLLSDIKSGFEVKLQNGMIATMSGVSIPTEYDPLPKLTAVAERMLRKEWKLFGGVLVESQHLIGDIIASKEGKDSDYEKMNVNFDGHRLFQVFELGATGLSEVMDTKPFKVILDENGSAASWDSGSQAIIVGANRSEQMGGWRKTRGTVAHEATHGAKSVNGQKTSEPAFATGVFRKDDHGNWVSYLDFEEGNNKLGESLIMGEEVVETILGDYAYVIVAGLVYRGFDDRQVAEVLKKLLVIEKLTTNPDADLISIEKSVASGVTTKIERLFRGTNPQSGVRVNGRLPIFTKDLAYYPGRLEAIKFWNSVAERAMNTDNPQEYLHHVFKVQNMGKINPTDSKQYEIAEKAYENRLKA